MGHLTLDTETTGTNSFSDRITQLAFIRYNDNNEPVFKYNEYIIPDGWEIKDIDWYKRNGYSDAEAYEKGKFFTENGMSSEKCKKLGVPLFQALRALQDNLKINVDLIVGHNIAFDKRFVLAEMNRKSIQTALLKFKKSYCTMNKARNVVNAVNKRGGKKAPNLTECVKHFSIKLGGDNFHDAFYDVEACNEVYKQLIKLNIK